MSRRRRAAGGAAWGSRRTTARLATALLVVAVGVALWTSLDGDRNGRGERQSAPATQVAASACEASPDGPTIDAGRLPPQAADTLALIEAGGPFPYDQDGSVFQNRERLLPSHDRGYYREYTVETPDSPDRGARRIVAGNCGERWYTDDHYDSFRLIVGSP